MQNPPTKAASQLDLRNIGVTSLYPRSYSSGINFQVVNGRVIKVDDDLMRKQKKLEKFQNMPKISKRLNSKTTESTSSMKIDRPNKSHKSKTHQNSHQNSHQDKLNQETINSLKLELLELKNMLNRKILKRRTRKKAKKNEKLRKQEIDAEKLEANHEVRRTIVLLYPQYVPQNRTNTKKLREHRSTRPVSMYF